MIFCGWMPISSAFSHCHTLGMQEAMAVLRLHRYPVLSEHCLFASVISTKNLMFWLILLDGMLQYISSIKVNGV